MTSEERPVRVLVAKPGLDSHDRGAKVIARAYRDAGMEVIYSGLRQSPDQVVDAAVQEDVDVIAISLLSGAHLTLVPKIIKVLDERGIDDIVVLVGGIIPQEDHQALIDAGVAGIFGPGADTREVVDFTRQAVYRVRRGEDPVASQERSG